MKISIWMRWKYLWFSWIAGTGSKLNKFLCFCGIHDFSYVREIGCKEYQNSHQVNAMCRHCRKIGADITGVY